MMNHILELIQARHFHQARATLISRHPVDLAADLENLEQPDLVRVFRLLPKDDAAEVFAYLSKELRKRIIDSLTDKELGGIMDELYLDDAVDIIEELPANVVKRLLQSAQGETRKQINHLLQYPDNSAGSIMTIEFAGLRRNMTVEQAFDYIRAHAVDKETIYTCYVMDPARMLLGVVSARTLLLAEPTQTVGAIMETECVSVQTLDDQEGIAKLFDRYDLLSVPVVDKEGRLVGIITIDDIVDVIQEENTEDFEKMAAMLPSDEPYLITGPLIHARRRLPWLLFLMVSAIFTGTIITFFEDSLAAIPALIAFIPMLMDTGGNCGAQAATLVIRGLALEQVSMKDWLQVLWKELRASILVGAPLAAINIVRILLTRGSLPLAMTVSLSLYATVVLAKLIGSLLPLLAVRIKVDPAIMASPVITTIVDAGSLMAYFGISSLIMHP